MTLRRASLIAKVLFGGLARLLFGGFAALLLAGATASLSAAPVFIRLIDVERQMPLEYWQRTDEQPAIGHPLHLRMPSVVLIDGKPVPFGRHEKADNDAGKNVTEDEDLAQELGLAAPTEKPARSDRAAEIEGGGGVKAQVTRELSEGEHTVHPGAATFTLQGNEVASAAKSGFTKSGGTALSLACHPVDLNLWTGSAADQKLTLPVAAMTPVVSGRAIAYPHILYFSVGDAWRRHGEDRFQAIAQFGQEWRRFPNFRGMIHTTGDGPTPATLGMVWAAGPGSFDIIHDDRLKKLREAFEFQVGALEVDDSQAKADFERVNAQMQGALGFGVGLQPSLKLKGTEATNLAWSNWVNDLYPQAFREQKELLARMIPDPLISCAQTWGPGAGGGMWPETFGQPLDHIINDIHGDYGIMPLSYSTGNDLICVGNPRRAWIGLDLIPERTPANGLKLLLEALSRNPDGIGSLNLSSAHAWPRSSSIPRRSMRCSTGAGWIRKAFRRMDLLVRPAW